MEKRLFSPKLFVFGMFIKKIKILVLILVFISILI